MSEIRATTISNKAGDGPITLTGQAAAKSWGVTTGTGTPSMNESFNVSSVTDSGTGRYDFNFTNDFASNIYTYEGNGAQNSGTPLINYAIPSTDFTAGTVITRNIQTGSTTAVDHNVTFSCFGDLA